MKRNMKQKGRDLLSLALCAAMLLSMMAFPAAAQEMTEQNQEEASSTNLETITTEGAVNTGTATETPVTEGEITENEITSTTETTSTVGTPLLNSAYYGTAITSDYKDLLSDPISDGCVYSFVNAGSGMYMSSTTSASMYLYTYNIYQEVFLDNPAQSFRLQATSEGFYHIIPLDYAQSEANHVTAYVYNLKNNDGSYVSNGIGNVTYNVMSGTSSSYEYKWRFERVEGSEDSYRIHLANTDYVLTAMDNHIGSCHNPDTSGIYSRGNIVIAPLNVMNERQIWHLESGGKRMHYGINLRETFTTTTNGIYAEICSGTVNTPHFSYPVTEYGYASSVTSTTNICSIDEDSVLSIERDAGVGNIRGSESDSSGVQKGYNSLQCYIYLPRGMYYITTIDNAYILSNNTEVTGSSYYHSLALFDHGGVEPTNHMQLFEFIYIGQGKYVISLMDYEHIVWYRASSSLFAYPTTIPDDYNDLPSERKWMLGTDSNGFYIYNESFTYTLTAPDTISSGSLPTLSSLMFWEKQYWNITKAHFLSGYEMNYNPEMWNNPDAASHDVQSATNCYNYALNFYSEMIEHFKKVYYDITDYDEETGVVTCSPKGISPKIINSYATLQPGIFDGESNDDEYLGEFVDIIALLQAVQEDSAVADFTFTEISQYDICPEGTYKVALIYGTDYHWYRQNSDGTWSHKPGTTEVTNLDAHGNIIFDPLYACSDTNYYTHFAGYYAVSAVVYECLIYGSLESFLSQ